MLQMDCRALKTPVSSVKPPQNTLVPGWEQLSSAQVMSCPKEPAFASMKWIKLCRSSVLAGD